MSDDQFLAELRAEVVAAADRLDQEPARPRDDGAGRRPPRAWRWLAAAAVVVGIVVGGVVLTEPPPAAAGVEVVRDVSGVTIRLTDLETRADEVVDAVSRAGIDVTVDEAPVGPSRVGRFVSASSEGLSAESLVLGGDTRDGFAAVRLPADFDGKLHLTLGRPAAAGEAWAAASDPTAPGELLECEALLDESLATVLARAEQLDGVDVRVLLLDEARWLSPDEHRSFGSTVVVGLTSPGPDELWIDTTSRPDDFGVLVDQPPRRC